MSATLRALAVLGTLVASMPAVAQERPGGPPLLPEAARVSGEASLDFTGGAAARSEGRMQRIVGGDAAPQGAYPSLVALMEAQGPGRWNFVCGGTVIARHWVLTAAHCVVADNGRQVPATGLAILEGTNQLASGRLVPVREVIPHPNYFLLSNPPFLHVFADVALLRLEEPSRQPRQALLAPALRDQLTRPGLQATVVGFGRTTARNASPNLMQVDLPLVAKDRCRQALRDQIFDQNICAGEERGGASACSGDSGGPLFLRAPGGGLIQLGVVSWGPAQCGRPGAFSVFAAVSDFQGFIRRYVPDAVFIDAAAPNPIAVAGGANPTVPPSAGGQVAIEVSPQGPVSVGTRIQVQVVSTVPGRLLLLNRDAAGRMHQLHPNRLAQPVMLRPGVPVSIPAPTDRFALTAAAPHGENLLIAAVLPPEARLSTLLAEPDAPAPIPDGAGFLTRLAEEIAAARVAMPNAAAPGLRQVQVTPATPVIATAEWRFTIVP